MNKTYKTLASAHNEQNLFASANAAHRILPRVWNQRDKNCPADAVYIGRPSVLGNPFKVGRGYPRATAVKEFALYALSMVQTTPEFRNAVLALKGKDLICWCAPALCHGDVLVWLANMPESEWSWKNLSKHLGLGY